MSKCRALRSERAAHLPYSENELIIVVVVDRESNAQRLAYGKYEIREVDCK